MSQEVLEGTSKKNYDYCYALCNSRGGFLLIDKRLPIYWSKKVAQMEASEFKATVKRVHRKDVLNLFQPITKPKKDKP